MTRYLLSLGIQNHMIYKQDFASHFECILEAIYIMKLIINEPFDIFISCASIRLKDLLRFLRENKNNIEYKCQMICE